MSACRVKDCVTPGDIPKGGVCDECWDHVRPSALAAIPGLWFRCHGHLPKGSRTGLSDDITRNPAGPRDPLSTAVLDTLRQGPFMLTGWANVALRCRGSEGPATVGKRWGFILSEAVGILAATDNELRHTSLAPDYVGDLVHLRSRMLALSGLDRLVHHLPAPCPDCNRRGLIRHNGREVILCPQCGGQWLEPVYQRYVVALLRNA